MRLFIAEKPSLAKAIVTGLPGSPENKGNYIKVGNDCVTWCIGHILEQAMPDQYLPDDIPTMKNGNKVWRMQDLPIFPDRWVLLPVADKKANLATIKDLLGQCSEVVNAGDPDQEGQLLVDEVLLYFGNNKPVKRVLINDYNETKVKQALSSIKDNNDAKFRGWYQWALARSHYDWLWGLNNTRAATLRARQLGGDSLLTIGSVQSPTLAIIVARDRAIEDFKPVPFFVITGKFKHQNGEFVANWKPGESQSGLDSEGRLLNQSVANSIVAKVSGKSGVVSAFEKKEKKQAAPMMYSLTDLQMAANDRYGYGAQQVLDACQALYETHKLTTYPRSDCQYLSEEQHKEARTILGAISHNRQDMSKMVAKTDPNKRSAVFNDKKVTAHHAIAPTERKYDLSKLSATEKNIYEMVVKSYLAQFMPEYTYMHTQLEVSVMDERFTATGKVPVILGWRELYESQTSNSSEAKQSDESGEGDDKEPEQKLPMMQQGDPALCVKADSQARKTSPPPRFTEKLLLAAMLNIHSYVSDPECKKRLKEGDGIGTEATRSSIIESLKRYGFIEPLKKGSKQLISTALGRSLVDFVPDIVKDPGQAGIFKLDLDAVANGNLKYSDFISQTRESVRKVIEQIKVSSMDVQGSASKSDGPPCPACGKGVLRRIKGKNGFFWGCSNYSNGCKHLVPDIKGKPGAKSDSNSSSSASDGPKCSCGKGTMRRINGAKGFFWGCSEYRNGCKVSMNDDNGKPVSKA